LSTTPVTIQEPTTAYPHTTLKSCSATASNAKNH